MAENSPQLAILGVGTMGRGMANSLLRAGFSPLLWNRNPQRLVPFVGTCAQIFDAVSDGTTARSAAHVRSGEAVITRA
jgi:3-hydroxyisobutyrate dehydrogenase-like beta-hydroxyacid dehydrogenase